MFFCLFAFCFSLREEGGERAGNWTQVSWLRTGRSACTPTLRSSLPERPGRSLEHCPAPGAGLRACGWGVCQRPLLPDPERAWGRGGHIPGC